MKLQELYNELYKIRKSYGSGLLDEDEARLDVIITRLDRLRELRHVDVNPDVSRRIKKGYLTLSDFTALETYLNDIDESTSKAISSKGNVSKETGSKMVRQKYRINFNTFIPIAVAVAVLVIGLSLGLTVFSQNQDALYFTLESIKDIIGSVISGTVVSQCINQRKGNTNGVKVVIIGAIGGIVALVIAIILFIGSDVALIERFTQWGKLTYLWMGLTVSIIAVISAVSVLWFLITYYSRKNNRRRW